MTHNLEPKLYFGDLFDQLKPEEKVEIIKPKVKRNETLDLIVNGYEKGLENFGLYLEHKLKIKIPESEFSWYYIAKLSAPSEIQSKEITEFSLLSGEHENKKDFEHFTGFYLSALINGSRDKDFKIITNYLSKTINNIGYKNNKNIDVNGNAGYGVGEGMNRGKITINGNAEDWVGNGMKGGDITVNGNTGDVVGGRMEGGEITINGNAEDWVGFGMKGGEITVNGNAGGLVGLGMEGGEITVNGNAGLAVGHAMSRGKIHLNGDYESLSIYVGNIYHKGKLIVENRRRV